MKNLSASRFKYLTVQVLSALFTIGLLASPAIAEHEGKIQILLLGDSTTEGSIPRLIKPQGPHLENVLEQLLAAEKDLPPCHVINSGLSGEYIRRLIDSGRYDRDAAKLPGLDYIFIRYGLNDRARVENFTEEFPKHFHELIDRLRKDHPQALLIPMTVIPYANEENSKEINDLVRQVAELEKLEIFDIYPRYAAELKNGPNMLNYRRYPLERVPEKYHELLKPFVQGPSVVVMDNELDAILGNLPDWYSDRHPNLAGYNVIADETAKYLAAIMRADASKPPEGFRAIFNGKDLDGWYGLNPHNVGKLAGEEKQASLTAQRAEFPKNWTVENGELVNDGHGPYATTEEEFGDIEFLIEYKTVAKADSGIYLRGTPQVQIWDENQVFDPKSPTRKPHLGSGGLFNNTPGTAGRDPLVIADKPFGEWNQFRIRQIGAQTWVWLNESLVVDGAVMENFWDRQVPLPAKGPIMLQTHGGEIRWRNIFVRDISAEEAQQILAATDQAKSDLSSALTLHASFDKGLDADFSRGDRTCYVKNGTELHRPEANEDAKLIPDAGRFGGALHFTKKSAFQPAFRDSGVLGYNDSNWSTTVSVWLRLNPDMDLEPGYCDPIQIVGDDGKKGFIFLEFSKDETPRYFRYAIRPLFQIWNPDNVTWADIPFDKRPMVQVERPPFSREAWTHVVFTLENVNNKTEPKSGRLYMNGELQGSIENWDLTFGWDPSQVLLVLGASYVGHMDDLAVFNRVLSHEEVKQIYGLKNGVRDLHTPTAK